MSGTRSVIPSQVTDRQIEENNIHDNSIYIEKERKGTAIATRSRAETIPNTSFENGIFNHYYTPWLGQQQQQQQQHYQEATTATPRFQSNTAMDTSARLQAQTPKRLRAFSMLDSAFIPPSSTTSSSSSMSHNNTTFRVTTAEKVEEENEEEEEGEEKENTIVSVTNYSTTHPSWLGNLHSNKTAIRTKENTESKYTFSKVVTEKNNNNNEIEKEPTRALWVGKIPSNTNQTTLSNIFMPFGQIESIRILNQKNCCFINFFHLQDAINAKRTLEKNEFIKGAGVVPIDFAKVPQLPTAKPEYQSIIKSFGTKQEDDDEEENDILNELYQNACCYHYRSVPPAPELGQTRKVDVGRLREIRKKLDVIVDWEAIVFECQDELVELCNDYIGNTIVQRLFERCSEKTKSHMLEIIAPYLASIGVHKNGTWAAQKIIETCRLPSQIDLICHHIQPYVPALLLDPFGNYVVQCCLGLGPSRNQFIFDAIVISCWEIAQGRFGARAIRATLESPFATKLQQKYVAVTIVQHALSLATNPNGALLLIWLLDTSCIPGRYIALAPRLIPHLGQLCTHKLASLTILKLVNQRPEPEAQRVILKLLFHNQLVLEEVVHDQVHGVNVIQKILCSSYIELSERQAIAERVKQLLYKLKLYHCQGYKRLVEEINMVKVDSVPDLNSFVNHQGGFIVDYLSTMNLYTKKDDNKLSNY